MGHHRFLSKDHIWRKWKKQFDRDVEIRDRPAQKKGAEIYEIVKDIDVVFG